MKFKLSPLTLINFTNKNQAYLIEASAGTGKTWTIERLFIKAVLERPELSLKQILLVTFTNIAVNELKIRVFEYLTNILKQLYCHKASTTLSDELDMFIQELINNEHYSHSKIIQILEYAKQNFDTNSIYTIHGFCYHIIKNNQLVLDVVYPFALIDNKKNIIKALINDFLYEKIINNSLFTKQIFLVFYNLMTLLNSKIDNNITNAIMKLIYHSNLVIFQNKQFRVNYKITINDNDQLESLGAIAANIDNNLEFLLDNNINKSTRTYFLGLLLHQILQYINLNYNNHEAIKLTNQLDCNDLISVVVDALNANQQLSDELFNEYPIAFIDEFQDTDYLQWQLFCNIYALGSNKINGGNRGNLIIVGDPKQAIYNFRNADINVYRFAKNTINNTITLTDNYRSCYDIINFFNQIFLCEHNQKHNYFGDDIVYQYLNAKVLNKNLLVLPTKNDIAQILLLQQLEYLSNNVSDEAVQVIAINGKDSEDKHNILLNNMIYEILLLINASTNLLDKIAILVTTNDEASMIHKSLKKYGINSSYSTKQNIFSSVIASEFLTILIAINKPNNIYLLKAALLTNLFNIPLLELQYFDINSFYLSDGRNIRQCFFMYYQKLQQSDIMGLIYQLINDLNIIANKYAQHLYQDDVNNLLHLGELLNQYINADANIKTPIELIHYFSTKIDNVINNEDNNTGFISDEINERSSLSEYIRASKQHHGIQIITQHKAKGLEFDIVFCPFFKKHIKKSNTIFNFVNVMSNPDTAMQNMNLLTNCPDTIAYNIKEHNEEINRLNYVTLTRAKVRIYIYLLAVKTTKNKYSAASKHEKIHELFGFNIDDNQDITHPIFNYPNIFNQAINSSKIKENLTGVNITNHQEINNHILTLLANNYERSLTKQNITTNSNNANIYLSYSKFSNNIYKQSYSSIIKYSNYNHDNNINYTLNNVLTTSTDVAIINYQYGLLNHYQGAKFGNFIHDCCERYPLDDLQASQLLKKYSIDSIYLTDAIAITHKIFTYPIIIQQQILQLANIPHKIYEFEFNLIIKNTISLTQDIANILSKYYGAEHIFVTSCKQLTTINKGFLTGFIDVLFFVNDKYYILDYKTNTLNNYLSCSSANDINNSLLQAVASHHYYLQYLLYLIAVKRYLQLRLNLQNVEHLLGGVVYYFIRGIFINNSNKNDSEIDNSKYAVYYDNKCIDLLNDIDDLFLL